MGEKKTELKLAAGGIGAILAMVIPIVLAVAKSLMESGLVQQGTVWYAVLAAIAAAAGAIGAAKISGDYSRSRAVVKAARAEMVERMTRPPVAPRHSPCSGAHTSSGSGQAH